MKLATHHKRLILMRHAKSSWGNPGLADHDRPLNERGIHSGRLLGEWLRENRFSPDEALISSARRTQETYNLLGLSIDSTVKRGLFHSSSDELIDAILKATGDTLLVVAHNPGIGDLALRLARMMRDHPDHSRFAHYPTGATFVIDYEVEYWADIDFSIGKIAAFTVPRELL